MTQTITKEQAYEKMTQSSGKIFTVNFVKKDGSNRAMNCRLGVKKHLKGGVLRYNPKAKNLLGIFDLYKQAYRMVNLTTIYRLKIEGKEYEVK